MSVLMDERYGYGYGYEDEAWEYIRGFPEYLISNFGRVWSIRNELFLKPRLSKWGYYYVRFCRNGINSDILIHRLVADNFIPTRFDEVDANEVNHEDGCKLYNDVFNLNWVTSRENQLHAYRTGLKKPAINAGRKKISVRIVETNEIFESLSDCARDINGSHSKISQCLRGNRKTHMGLHFEYVTELISERR